MRLTQEALHEGKVYNNLHWAQDGVEALDFLKRRGKHAKAPRARHHPARPEPAEEGRPRGALGDQAGRRPAQAIPVVILTTSKAEEDVLKSYDLHANCYVTKPVDLDKFIVVVQSIDRFWLTVVTLPTACGVKSEEPGQLASSSSRTTRATRASSARCSREDSDAPFELRYADRLVARPRAALAQSRPGWCCSTCRCPTATGWRPSPRSTRTRPRCRSSCSPGNDDQHARALRGEERRAGLPGQGQDRPRAAAAARCSTRSSASATRRSSSARRTTTRSPGLPNRHLLHDRLKQAVFAQRTRASIAVVFIDLDHFKVINDSPRPQLRRRGAAPRGRAPAAPRCATATRWRGWAATSSC